MCRFCSNTSPTANAVPPLPLESVKGSLRSRRWGNGVCARTEIPTHKADSRGRLSLQKNKLRAGRRARERDQVLLYVLRGEKSVIGGTSSPSVAPHLNRWLVREVRSEFSQSVARASGRSTCKVVCFFCNFSFKQRKVNNPRGKGTACADEGACGFCSNYSSTANAVPLPSQGKARGRCTPAVWATRSELCRMRE